MEIKCLIVGIGTEVGGGFMVGKRKDIELPQDLRDKVSRLVADYYTPEQLADLLNEKN